MMKVTITRMDVTAVRSGIDHGARFHRRRRGRVVRQVARLSTCVVAAGLLLLSCAPGAPQQTPAAAPPGAPAPPAAAAGGAGGAAAPAAAVASSPGPAPRLETVKIATQPIPN